MLAYSNPWSSPLGWQLEPSRRETVCAALNSAILGTTKYDMKKFINNIDDNQIEWIISESINHPWRPPLEVCAAHTHELLKLMANSSIGSCAFVNVDDILNPIQ